VDLRLIDDKLSDRTFTSGDCRSLASYLEEKILHKDLSYFDISEDDVDRLLLVSVLLEKQEISKDSITVSEWRNFGDENVYLKLRKIIDELRDLRIINTPTEALGGLFFFTIVERRRYTLYLYEIVKSILKNVKMQVNESPGTVNSAAVAVMDRIDPELKILSEWIRSNQPKDFERAVSILLSLSGLRSIHIGDDYERATLMNRREKYRKSSVGLDILVLSHNNENIIIGQCSTDFNDDKITDILNIHQEFEKMLLKTKQGINLHPAIFTTVSRTKIQESERKAINRGIKLFTSEDLDKIFNEVVAKGKIFSSVKELMDYV
jgi:hypothetical protein